MELNEKLDIFFHATIEAANGKSQEILEEQKALYAQSIESYEKMKQEELATRVRIAQSQAEKEENRKISGEILCLKKEYHSRQETRKKELFELVEKHLASYRRTEAYREFLHKKIAEAGRYAGGAAMKIYIDPEDAAYLEELSAKAACEVRVGKESFGGGIRAVIRDRNLLIDESLGRKLAEEKEKFSF